MRTRRSSERRQGARKEEKGKQRVSEDGTRAQTQHKVPSARKKGNDEKGKQLTLLDAQRKAVAKRARAKSDSEDGMDEAAKRRVDDAHVVRSARASFEEVPSAESPLPVAERRTSVQPERALIPVDLAAKCDASELILRLQAAYRAFKRVQQGQADESVRDTARALGSDRFLKHQEYEVRLLTSCGLTEVLRIFAPDAPFSKRSENAIFELFVRQLAGLEQVSSPFFKTCVELLEKLALLKAFVLVMDNEEIMCDLFQCICRIDT